MTPAIEYLTRTELIKEWLDIPCSIFLTQSQTQKKLVITITEEFIPSELYSIKHWDINNCQNYQVLPGMKDFRVLKKEIFNNHHVIIKNYNILQYAEEPIISKLNNYGAPMSSDLFKHLTENQLKSYNHTKKRLNWLWKEFTKIYLPNLQLDNIYINSAFFPKEEHILIDQRIKVSKYMKKEWRYWQKWQKYLLLNPGELFFTKEYPSK